MDSTAVLTDGAPHPLAPRPAPADLLGGGGGGGGGGGRMGGGAGGSTERGGALSARRLLIPAILRVWSSAHRVAWSVGWALRMRMVQVQFVTNNAPAYGGGTSRGSGLAVAPRAEGAAVDLRWGGRGR